MPRPTPAEPRRTAPPVPSPAEGGAVRFGILNWVLLAAGAVLIIGGYALLGSGSTVAAPLLLVLGYAVLIPLGIIWQEGSRGA